MTVTTIGVCDLCSERGPVVAALAAYRSLVFPFGSIDRCEDSDACKARVEASGEPWPLLEPGERPEVGV